ncbi:hypothetical protein [Limnoglobus roseus]|nr:hypothetical protein [Limnoglobus roseus]
MPGLILSVLTVITSGAITGWCAYRLQAYHMPGLPEPDFAPLALALSALPTALFLLATGVGRRSVALLISVPIAAVVVALARVYAISTELSAPWTHGTGLISLVAWGGGVGVSLAFVGIATVVAVRRVQR